MYIIYYAYYVYENQGMKTAAELLVDLLDNQTVSNYLQIDFIPFKMCI